MTNRHERRTDGQSGFSLIELLVVVAIAIILMTIGVGVSQSALTWAKAQASLNAVKSQIIEARDLALSTRRSVEVRFVGNNEIQLHRYELDGTTTQIGGTVLENRNQFRTFPGIPDSPDGFGNAAALDFDNAAAPYLFTADGTFVDAAGVPLTGTVFLGVESQPATARAVTVFGGTGRVVGYFWDGKTWLH